MHTLFSCKAARAGQNEGCSNNFMDRTHCPYQTARREEKSLKGGAILTLVDGFDLYGEFTVGLLPPSFFFLMRTRLV
jgi:hypothetical protein